MDYQISPLILTPPKSGSRADVYIAPKELVEESNLGVFFVIIEIASAEKSIKKVSEQIVGELLNEYYQSSVSDIEAALESACQKFNENILSSSGKDKKWFSKLNILVTAFKDNELVMSNFGKMSALLFRKSKTINILDASNEEKMTKGKSFKIFSQVVSGEIKESDILIFTTPSLLDYFSHEKIKKTCETLSVEQATESFRGLLSDNITPTSFGSVILKIPKTPDLEQEKVDNLTQELADLYTGPQASMDQLHSLERKTGKLLTASLWPNLRLFIAKVFEVVKKILTFKPKDQLKLPKQDKKIEIKATSTIKDKLNKIMGTVASIPNGLKDTLVNIQLKFKKEKKPGLEIAKNVKATKEETSLVKLSEPKTLKIKSGRMSLAGKIYLATMVILIVAFVTSIWIISKNKAHQILVDEFEQKITFVKDKTNAAEAALIYQDEEKAQKLLKDAAQVVEELKNSDSKIAQQEARQVELLEQSLETVTLKIHHITKLETLESVANFSTLPNKSADFALKDMAYTESGDLYILDNNKSVYRVDLKTNSFSPSGNLDLGTNVTDVRYLDKNVLVLKDETDTFFDFDTTKEKGGKLNTATREDTKVADWQTYSKKVYLIDYVNNQIYSFPKAGTDLAPRSAWLKTSEVTFTENASMVIDGNIWVVDNSKITKFYKGQPQNFSVSGLEKDFGPKAKIYTNGEVDNLYILDKDNLKVIVVDKNNGKVKEQFIYPESYNITSITTSADGRVIYLLGVEKVYKLGL